MGGMVEEGLKSSKIMSYSAIKATTQAIQNATGGVIGKKKKEECGNSGFRIVSYTQPQWHSPVPQNTYPAPQNAYPPPRAYRNPPGPSLRPNPTLKNERQRKKTFTPLGESYTSLFHRLRQLDMLRPIKSKLPNMPPKNLDYSVSCEYCSGTPGHDTEKSWNLKNAIQELIDTNRIEIQTPEAPNINQNLLPVHEGMNMIEIACKGGEPKKPSQSVMMILSSEVQPTKGKSVAKPMVEGALNKLSMKKGEPSVVVEKRSTSDTKSKVIVPGLANRPILIVKDARTDPVIIKPVTQLPIINTKVFPWSYERVTETYTGKEVKEEVNEAQGLTRQGRCFAPEELRKAKAAKDNSILVKKAVTEEEAEEFLRKMKVQDYSIVEQLRKTPAQISLLSLLIHLDEHRRALMKILNEAHVPDKISVNHLEKIANKIFEVNRITFSDDEFPMEGTEHNKALYLTVKCEESVVTKVLVDNGSSANICPLSTLNKLKVDDERIHKNSICVRGFDGGGKDSVGDIMVKFEWDRQEIVVPGEDNLCAHSDASVPFIEAKDDEGPWV
ncbi:PREDICTED: uncharacterized protein LOC109236720 [Nicotiana attenuata]|uniref:uncharacterized protein LOC109236720 n=1 Tax=Nicotiana attenuata TaxID=49451 RepID=UPI000904D60C|nr:PREDICTED: uncharacterized protein LOC109236720 [Nicotiana attenuata]